MTDKKTSPHEISLNPKQVKAFRQDVLKWYDRHRRVLPWRALPNQTTNPYHVWLSEIMLQQTVVAAVIPYFQKFVENWPSVHDLAAAPQEEVMSAWAGLGYYARARNLHKCAQIVAADYGGVFPDTQDELKKLPGIGDYTSAAIASIAFDKPAVVVDGNIERVMARYFAVTAPLPDGKKILREKAALLADGQTDRPGDYAQALMDIGAAVCIPKSARCVLCPLQKSCQARKEGIQDNLPARRKKQPKPQKQGYVYWLKNSKGEILCHRRPEKGMLGGMTGLPTSEWVDIKDDVQHIDFKKKVELRINKKLYIKHSFTHFDLKLYGIVIEGGDIEAPDESYFWQSSNNISGLGFPTLFKKFVRLMAHDNKKKAAKT